MDSYEIRKTMQQMNFFLLLVQLDRISLFFMRFYIRKRIYLLRCFLPTYIAIITYDLPGTDTK